MAEDLAGANTEQSLEDVLLAAAALIAATSELDLDRPSPKVPVPRTMLLELVNKVDAASPSMVERFRAALRETNRDPKR